MAIVHVDAQLRPGAQVNGHVPSQQRPATHDRRVKYSLSPDRRKTNSWARNVSPFSKTSEMRMSFETFKPEQYWTDRE
jgi:hypothetical protein